jgi:hypothetical protein
MKTSKIINLLKEIPNFSLTHKNRLYLALENLSKQHKSRDDHYENRIEYNNYNFSIYQLKKPKLKIAAQYTKNLSFLTQESEYKEFNIRISGEKNLIQEFQENLIYYTKTGFPKFLSN